MTNGIEMQFLTSWKSWDQLDTASMIFMEVELKQEVADMIGRDVKAEWFTVDTESSFIQVGYGEDDFVEYQLKASLGAQL
jgi:hypothetical protein